MKKLIIKLTTLVVLLGGFIPMISVNAQKENGYVGTPDQEYYLISFLSGIDYWKSVFSGFEDAATNFGVSVQYTGDTTADVSRQVDIFEQVAALEPAGIAIAAVNADALEEPINRAIENGIPVVTYDSDSPNSNRISYLSTGNSEVGAQSARYFDQLVPNGKVALLYTVGAENSEARVAGFLEEIENSGLSIEVVAQVNDNGDQIEATSNMAAALQANDEINAIFAVNGVAGVAGPTAVLEAGLQDEITVVAFDTDTAVLDMIKSGQIHATVAQGTYSMGYWSLNFLYNIQNELGGTEFPSFVDTGITFVESDTVDQYYPE